MLTEHQIITKINTMLAPKGETYDRAYHAFEGGVRVISKDGQGRERRYSFHIDNQTDEIALTEM